MGNCASVKPFCNSASTRSRKNGLGSKYYDSTGYELSNKEIYCLRLIYKDLSSRSKSKTLSLYQLQNFLGISPVLAASLFSIFKKQHASSLTQNQFIQNMLSMRNIELQNRSKILFQVLDIDGSEGLSRKQLLQIFLSCPHQSVNQILKNQEFINNLNFKQLAQYLIISNTEKEADVNSYSISPYLLYKKNMKNSQDNNLKKNTSKKQPTQFRLQNCSKQTARKMLVNQFNKNLYNTSLIPKYVSYLFNKYEIDQESEEFNLQQFSLLYQENQLVFESFFEGFNEYLWRHQSGIPMYKSLFFTVYDACTMVQSQLSRAVYITLIKTSILVFQCEQMVEPIAIKSLQGLFVKPIKGSLGNGFALYHLDSSYPQSKFYFQDTQRQKEWLEHLKQYRQRFLQQKYQILDKIGEGSSSQVYLCQQIQSRQKYAVKIIQKTKQNDQYPKYRNQGELMKFCKHQNILSIKQIYETKRHLYIILQYFQSINLRQYSESANMHSLNQQQIKQIMWQLLIAVNKIHNLGIIHGDIRLENILVQKQKEKLMGTPHVKLIDFGDANYQVMRSLHTKHKNISQSEQITDSSIQSLYQNIIKSYSLKSDIYSLGVIMFFLISREMPSGIHNNNIQQIFVSYKWKRFSYKAKDLIKKLLSQKQARISCSEALAHEWFQ